jgi:hypothetical protein
MSAQTAAISVTSSLVGLLRVLAGVGLHVKYRFRAPFCAAIHCTAWLGSAPLKVSATVEPSGTMPTNVT